MYVKAIALSCTTGMSQKCFKLENNTYKTAGYNAGLLAYKHFSSYCVIVRVGVVLKRTVVGD